MPKTQELKNIELYGVKLVKAELHNAELTGGVIVENKAIGAELKEGVLIEGELVYGKYDNKGRRPNDKEILLDLVGNQEDYEIYRNGILKQGGLQAGLIRNATLTANPNSEVIWDGIKFSNTALISVSLTGIIGSWDALDLTGALFYNDTGRPSTFHPRNKNCETSGS